MANELTKLTNNLEYAVDCFRPLLKELNKNQSTPIYLSSFPGFKNLDGIGNWIITILKFRITGIDSKLIFQHDKNQNVWMGHIVLSENLFKEDVKEIKERKKVILVHEFCHFLALFYASFKTEEAILRQKFEEKFAETERKIANRQVMQLYQILDESKTIDDFSYIQAIDEHFRIGTEDVSFNYGELYRNLLLSRQMFEEYFTPEKRKLFFSLFGTTKSGEAEQLLIDVINRISEAECLPRNFVINQTNDIIMKFYLKEFK